MIHYIVAFSYRRAREFADERGWTERRHDKRPQWIAATRNSALRGRTFDADDQVHVLPGAEEGEDYQTTIQELRQIEIISLFSPTWHWHREYDLPRAGEDLEAWLAR